MRPSDVRVLAQFDVPFGSLDEEPSVSPGRQAVWREPVDANVAVTLVRAEDHFSEVLESRRIGHGRVFDMCMGDLGGVGSGEMQELVDLVRADVAENPAVAFSQQEPWRACPEVLLVGAEADRLDDSSDGAS